MGRSSFQVLVDNSISTARDTFDRTTLPRVVVSPYRMNPLGAHIDHQGGSVLARTINQYSVVAFYPRNDSMVRIHCALPGLPVNTIEFNLGDDVSTAPENAVWAVYAMGAAAVSAQCCESPRGIDAVVDGTLSSSGLSSSASVILAYLMAFAESSGQGFADAEWVEMARRVENDFVGLASGLQDQMSIVFGQEHSLSLLDMQSVTAEQLPNPSTQDELAWVLCYSGFSRELISSGFNTRVSECCEAAALLSPGAQHLGQVPVADRSADRVALLPTELQRRVTHVYGEMQRVAEGSEAWVNGDATRFGALMNQSCQSSINQYECGTQPMIDLHEIASRTEGVFGSRFGGGGYGGCLIMLCDSAKREAITVAMDEQYGLLYPEKRSISRVFEAQAESHVRLL